MLQASQLNEVSSRFSGHVQDIREFLLKEKLPVPSPEAIPQLSNRLEADPRFRADVGSLMRATLYQEREEIGYEDLLGILVAAAAGAEHDLKSDSQEAEIRELLRFLLQSRRTTFHPDAEETRERVEPVPRDPIPVEPVPVSEPVLVGALRSSAESRRREPRFSEPAVAVAEHDSREPDDSVLPLFRTSGLFAAQAELETPRSKTRSIWVVGLVGMLLGVGAGLMINRVAPEAETHFAGLIAGHFSSHAKPASSIAPKESATGTSAPQKPLPVATPAVDQKADAGVGKEESTGAAAETASLPEDNAKAVPAAAPVEVRSAERPATLETSAGVPVTVTKQVVTAFPSRSLDSDDPAAQSTAATRSIVSRASAGIMPANVIFSPAPEYPAAAAAARVQGEVTVRAVVGPDGKVIYTRAVSGPTLLREAAQEAVQRWRYRPLLYNGKPIAVTTVAIVDFKFAK